MVARSTHDFAKDPNVISTDNLLDRASPVAPLVERLRQVQQALRVTKFWDTHVSYAPGQLREIGASAIEGCLVPFDFVRAHRRHVYGVLIRANADMIFPGQVQNVFEVGDEMVDRNGWVLREPTALVVDTEDATSIRHGLDVSIAHVSRMRAQGETTRVRKDHWRVRRQDRVEG